MNRRPGVTGHRRRLTLFTVKDEGVTVDNSMDESRRTTDRQGSESKKSQGFLPNLDSRCTNRTGDYPY